MADAVDPPDELSEELEHRLRAVLARILALPRVEEIIRELRTRPRVKPTRRSAEGDAEATRILKGKGII